MEEYVHDFQVLYTEMAIPLGTQQYMIRDAINIGDVTDLNVDTHNSGNSLILLI